jgi:hypothetical protein
MIRIHSFVFIAEGGVELQCGKISHIKLFTFAKTCVYQLPNASIYLYLAITIQTISLQNMVSNSAILK